MIMANVAVASYIANANLPGIYRVHGDVNVDRLKKFLNVLQLLGISVKENLNNVNQKTIQRILNLIKDNKAFQVLAIQMLSCMDKAKYQTIILGILLFLFVIISHFTSPIRRYPVQRPIVC